MRIIVVASDDCKVKLFINVSCSYLFKAFPHMKIYNILYETCYFRFFPNTFVSGWHVSARCGAKALPFDTKHLELCRHFKHVSPDT